LLKILIGAHNNPNEPDKTGYLGRSAIDELAYLKSNLTKMRLSHIDCKRFYKDLMI